MKAALNSLLLILAPAALIVALGSLAFNRGPQPIPAADCPALSLPQRTLTSVSNLDTIAWWSQIETNDLAVYRDRLRAIGCPEPTVQDILIGLIQRRFARDLDALSTESAPPFWHTLERQRPAADSLAVRQQSARLAVEQQIRTAVRDLLGLDLDDHLAHFSSHLDGVTALASTFSAASRPGARRVLEHYERLENSIVQRCGGTLGLPEQTELRQLYQRKLDELRPLVSAQELEQFELRSSPLADRLRQTDLIGFDPTEEEFRTIYRAARDWQHANDTGTGEEISFNDLPLREVLGEGRYADYRRAQDLTYRNLVEFLSFFGLASDAATQVHVTRETVLEKAARLQDNSALDDTGRKSALEQIQSLARTEVQTVLGPDAYGRYIQSSLGNWIDRISTWTNGVVLRN